MKSCIPWLFVAIFAGCGQPTETVDTSNAQFGKELDYVLTDLQEDLENEQAFDQEDLYGEIGMLRSQLGILLEGVEKQPAVRDEVQAMLDLANDAEAAIEQGPDMEQIREKIDQIYAAWVKLKSSGRL